MNDPDEEFIFLPDHEYPDVGPRPVRWGNTKIHYSRIAFAYHHTPGFGTICGLRIPQLAVVLPTASWQPGSDEVCRLCLGIGH